MNTKVEAFEQEDLLDKSKNVAVNRSQQNGNNSGRKTHIPVRFWIGLMVFLTTYINYTTRVNISISIISMTRGKSQKIPECLRDISANNTGTNSTILLPDYGPRYDWDQNLQGYLIGCYFWGYCISSLPGGVISEMLGPYKVIVWTHVGSAILNSLSVFGTHIHFSLLMICRLLLGLMAAIPPYLRMMKSIPFWMLTTLHFGNLYGLYLQLTMVPKFMAEVIGFNLKAAGGLSALPHLSRLFLGTAFGSLGDYLKKKQIVSNAFIRKFFVLFSHIIPGILLIGISFTGCNYVTVVILLTLSMSVNGAAVLTNLQNPQDLAPNFAGSIFGIISFIGGMTGFIGPAVTSAFIKDNNGIKEWGYTFILGGCIYCACGTLFILFGSVQEQSWNRIADEKKEDDQS
ncbi:unnamed protein product [Phaedon cochleariae]|uniref:Sialin n=1 Tax=Phaedon cochleariae TaxID=80249 RepID=A0A9P0GNB1_PHACE|nr:unnamed protein product [Phaedon cochleariae]